MDAKRMATYQLYSTVNRKERIDRRISGLTSVQRLSTERGGEGKSKPPFTPLENLRNRQEVSVAMAHRKTNVDPGGSESTSVGKKLHRTHAANIKEKISQWEGKEPPPPSPKGGVNKTTDSSTKSNGKPAGESQRAEDSGAAVRKDKQNSGKENIGMRGDLRPCSPAGRVMEPTGWLQNRDGRPGEGHKGLDCNKPDKEKPNINDVDRRPGSPMGAVTIHMKTLRADSGGAGLERSTQEKKAVFTLFRKLEQAMGENVRKTPAELGNYFSPPGRDTQGVARQATQPDAATGPLDASREERQRRGNTYNVPGTPPMINPVPKPQRTFQHPITVPPGKVAGQGRSQSNLYPCPPVSPPPSASQPPLGVYRRPRGNKLCDDINRKSFEFEDLPVSHSQSVSPGFPGTLSQEHHYEDIPDLSNENPYEDIEVASLCSQQSLPPSPGADTNKPSRPGFFRQSSAKSFKMLDLRRTHHRTHSSGSAGVSSPPQLSPTGSVVWLPGEPYNQTCRRIPTIVLKINSIFEARIGKKHLRRVCHYYETSSGRDENSDSESEVEERPNADRHRPVPLQSSLSQLCQKQAQYSDAPSRPSSLREAQRQELHQRQLFEYFLVVSLQKAKAGAPYLPKVTQQFPPKLERSFKFMRETEDQLRIIPQFCFPDAEDWEPVESYPSEMFSFVLTGEDGSRRFGYCRRLLPSGKGRRLPEVYCIVSHLGCFNLFSKVLDEVERRRALSPALVQPFMRAIMEAQFPAPGRTITIKTFLPGSGTEVMELCRPPDSRLEHVDLECLFTCLSLRLLLRVLGSLLLERRVIFTARKLSTLSQCCHAAVALLYPFVWQHTYIPVLPSAMLDIVCTPTPFIVGLLSTFLPQLTQLPLEEVLVVDLENSRILRQSDDEDCTLPSKLQSALEIVLEKRRELANERGAELPNDSGTLSTVVSEAFVRFFVELVGHYPLFVMGEREDGYSSSSSSPVPCSFQAEAFRKSVTSKSVRRFLEVFMETQMFSWFIQEREQHSQAPRGLFEVRVQEYLDSIQENEHRRVNRFLKGLGNKMKFLSKK